jgi:hypothetical protein
MCCSACSKAITLRHDMLLQSLRQIAHHAGMSTAGEPRMDRLQNAVPPTVKTAVTSSPSSPEASLWLMYPSFKLRLLPISLPLRGLLVLLLHLVMHSSSISIMLAVSPLPSPFLPYQWSLSGV